MSKINELVEKLCPNGVEFKPIWSVTIWDKKFNGVEKFKQNKVISYKYFLATDFNKIEDSKGNIKYISTGISQEDRYTTEELAGDYLAEGEIVCIPWGGTPNIKYHKGKFVTGDNRIATSADTNILNNKYLYYWMCSKIKEIESFYRGSGIKHPNMKSVLDMTIAVPPLEVQDEIVHILDDFTLLSAELSAELKARQKQYEFYKDKIWENVRNYKPEKMSNLCEIGDGLHGTPIYSEGTALWFINGNNLDNGKITISSNTKEVSQESYNKHFIDMKNDSILLSINGTIGKTAYYNGEKVILGKSVAYFNIIDTTRIMKEYLYFYFQSQDAMNYYECSKTGSTIKNLGLKALRDMNIPLPSIEKQKKIVDVLIRFDKLCNDISEGLPAEIEARQKQYEYYRDKLLTFKELVNEG